MFEYHFTGLSYKPNHKNHYHDWHDFCLDESGRWLLDRKRPRIIDLVEGTVAFEFGKQDKFINFNVLDDGKLGLWRESDQVGDCWVERGLLLDTKSLQVIDHDFVSWYPVQWEHEGHILKESRRIYENDGNTGTVYKLYYDNVHYVLVNEKEQKMIADLSANFQQFLQGTKESETVMRGGGITLTTKNPGTSVPSHQISRTIKSGDHLAITFKQTGSFFSGPHGVQGACWYILHDLASGLSTNQTVTLEGISDANYECHPLQLQDNGSMVFGAYDGNKSQELYLHSPVHGLKKLIGREHRFMGALWLIIRPRIDQLEILLFGTKGSTLLLYSNDGELISKTPLKLTWMKSFREIDVDFQEYLLFHCTKHGGVALNTKTWQVIPFEALKLETYNSSNYTQTPTGWFDTLYRGRYHLGYLSIDGTLPDAFHKVCKLLGTKPNHVNARKVAKPARSQNFLDELNGIGFFDGYPEKEREKMERRASKTKASHIIDMLETIGVKMDDSYREENRLTGIFDGEPYVAERLLYETPACNVWSMSVDHKGRGKAALTSKVLTARYERGTKVIEAELDATQLLTDVLAFMNLIMPTRKMTAKAYFVRKDDKATIISTNATAIAYLRDTYDLEVIEAVREFGI